MTPSPPDCEDCFEDPVTFALSFAPGDIAVADFDGDEVLDVALQHASSGTGTEVSLLLADGDGGFSEVGPFEVGAGASAVVAGDFDGDGHADVATSGYADGEDSVTVLAGDGAGGFAAANTVAVPGRPFHLAAGDFDEDGRDDLVIAKFSSGELGLIRGRADRNFTSAVVGELGSFPTRVCVGDANGDGWLDAMGGYEQFGGNFRIFLGDGSGGLAAGEVHDTAGGTPWGCAVGDLDGDGRPDIAVAKKGDSRVQVLHGVSDGFWLEGGIGTGPGAYELTIDDFDRDGHDDVAVSHDRDDRVLVLYSSPELVVNFEMMSETFFVRSESLPVNAPVDVIAADMNGDGRPDLVTASALSQQLVVAYAR